MSENKYQAASTNEEQEESFTKDTAIVVTTDTSASAPPTEINNDNNDVLTGGSNGYVAVASPIDDDVNTKDIELTLVTTSNIEQGTVLGVSGIPQGTVLQVITDASTTPNQPIPSQTVIEKPNPTFTRHFWKHKQYALNRYETYASKAARHPCCCFKLCFCSCRDFIEPGTLDHCSCFFPSTCYYCITKSTTCEDCCCTPIEWCCLLPCNIFLGPCKAINHNVMYCCGYKHRYNRKMRYYDAWGEDRTNTSDPCDDCYWWCGYDNNHTYSSTKKKDDDHDNGDDGKSDAKTDKESEQCCKNCDCDGDGDCDCGDCDCDCDI